MPVTQTAQFGVRSVLASVDKPRDCELAVNPLLLRVDP